MNFKLAPASKAQLHARIALVGPSGSGKTYSALEAALALTDDIGKVAVVDSERGSAALYTDVFGPFLHGVLDPPYTPGAYVAALEACADAGAEVIVTDSLSHAWSGQGGILEQVDDYAAKQRGEAGKFGAWREATPAHNRLVDTLIRLPAHVVVTMRAKTAYAVEEVDGKLKVRKLGLQPEQRAGLEYEFDVVVDIDLDHVAVVTKSRFSDLQDAVESKPGRDWWRPFVVWLSSGERLATPHEQVAELLEFHGLSAAVGAIVGRYHEGAKGVGDLPVTVAARLADHLRSEDSCERIKAGVAHLVEAEAEAEVPF